jgi:hypothetical protein
VNARVPWPDLPINLRQRIEAETGRYVSDEPVGAGHNCLLGTVLTAQSGRFFLKGVPSDHRRAVWTQSNEATINPHVAAVTASLAFHIQAAGWDVLGFEYLDDHRHADLAPDSPDLPKVGQTLAVLAGLSAPQTVALRTIVDRWSEYVGERAALLGGSTIAHTDLHRHNILVAGTAKLIDWAWPTLAAPWFDTACVGLQLIVGGHKPCQAEQWCRGNPAYADATDDAVYTFVEAAQLMWHEIGVADPQPWKLDVASAAAKWAEFRGTRR